MRPTRPSLAAIALVACLGAPAAAQHRLLQDGDLELRAAAAQRIGATLRTTRGELTMAQLAGAATASAEALPEGSRVRARLAAAVAAAREVAADGAPGAERRALESLQGDLEDVRDDLKFEPVREAEVPEGFPAYRAVDEIELRQYPAYRMVKASTRGGEMGSFWTLFRHIESNSIAMTAPVQMDWQEPISGDTRSPSGQSGPPPVGPPEGAARDGSPGALARSRTLAQREDSRGYGPEDAAPRTMSMAFLYGSPEIGTPGRIGKVEVVDVAPTTVLSIGGRGNDTRARVEELRETLEEWLRAHPEWRAAGPMRTMGYNSPMVRGDRRYFEVQLPVERDPRRPL